MASPPSIATSAAPVSFVGQETISGRHSCFEEAVYIPVPGAENLPNAENSCGLDIDSIAVKKESVHRYNPGTSAKASNQNEGGKGNEADIKSQFKEALQTPLSVYDGKEYVPEDAAGNENGSRSISTEYRLES